MILTVIKHFKKQYTARPKKTTDNEHDDNNHTDIDANATVDDDEEIQMAYGESILPSRQFTLH